MILKSVKMTWLIRPQWLHYGVVVAGIHLLGLALMLVGVREYPAILGFGFLAYTLGLRHAFDADHIAAIDNSVRKLIQQGENPTGIGFFFSLGHSTVVFIMTLIMAFSISWAKQNLPQLQTAGTLIGTLVSGVFLILIGIFNLKIWFDIYGIFSQMRRGKTDEGNLEQLLLNRGFLSRFFGPLFRCVSKSWHVYPMGFLFGLGFDTASEVALLAISANAATHALPLSVIISLPVLFAAGMSLMDTADGVFMATAYNWAFATPLRKIYYNLSITGLSVVAALIIGLVELAQIISQKAGLNNGIWRFIQNIQFGEMGYLLVGLFIAAWILSYLFWKVLRIDNAL